MLGGVSDGVIVANANRYNATTNIWASIAPVPVASEAPAAALLDGKIYLAEGSTGDSFNIYDIASNTWSAGPPRPGYANNYGAAAGAFGGKVYVVGGDSSATDTTSIYTVATNSWTTGAPAPVPFFLAGYTTVGQYLYVAGGFNSASPTANVGVTMRLDMATGTWSLGPTYTPGRADEGLAASGHTLYALGGDATGGGYFDSTVLVDSLDVSAWPSGSWTSVADPLPSPRQGNEAGFFSTGRVGGEVWSTGGINGATFTFLNEHLYKAAPLPPPPPPRLRRLRLRHRLHRLRHLRLRPDVVSRESSGCVSPPRRRRSGERTVRLAGFDAFVRAARCGAAW